MLAAAKGVFVEVSSAIAGSTRRANQSGATVVALATGLKDPHWLLDNGPRAEVTPSLEELASRVA